MLPVFCLLQSIYPRIEKGGPSVLLMSTFKGSHCSQDKLQTPWLTKPFITWFLLLFPLSYLVTIPSFPPQFPKWSCLQAFKNTSFAGNSLHRLTPNIERLALLIFWSQCSCHTPGPMLPWPQLHLLCVGSCYSKNLENHETHLFHPNQHQEQVSTFTSLIFKEPNLPFLANNNLSQFSDYFATVLACFWHLLSMVIL